MPGSPKAEVPRREIKTAHRYGPAVKTPVLLTHHFRTIDAAGRLLGALADVQASRARELVTAAGNRCDYLSFPEMGHAMHTLDPELFAKTLTDLARSLPGVP
ncbi:hypothetical protein [Yinghuangia soli]|uniref:Uncharacterized protein n=1 Tax=Yinghuangia soli TaxID=2908204 RepID=A0AA41U4F8_9ACTN|nr:hypothetical protein [Yinghuangia soli]MCF2532861.1 hypothetical protein [Yinghuangia soli]